MSELKSTIMTAMKDAMRSGKTQDLGVIRLIQAAIKQKEVDERIQLQDEQILALLDKMVRQRRDVIPQFVAAGRQDLADKESYEIEIIQAFMPSQLSEAEVETLIKEAIQHAQASSIRDMAKVMQILKPQLQGRADMTKVSTFIKDHLSAMSG